MAFGKYSRVLVVGLGSSGLAAARLAAEDGSEVWATDLRGETELETGLGTLGGDVRTFLGGHPDACLDGVELVITSPGVSADRALLETARRRGIEINTEIEFAWRHQPRAEMVAVTGSNGKSTVTELTTRMMVAAGRSTAAGGNLGTPASRLVLDGGWESWVLEISSFQAELLTSMAPSVAVFLNLSQDHLERHADLDSYLAAKRRLFAFQDESDTAILNADDPLVADTRAAARRRFFSIAEKADACLEGEVLTIDGEPIVDRSELLLSGIHNAANVLAAALAADALGVPKDAMAEAANTFAGLAHRHRTVHDSDGILWVDDSKATNVGATLAALRGYPDRSLHLILGGQAKDQDFSVLAEEIRRAVRRLYLIGEDASMIAEALAGATMIEGCGNLAEAVARARRNAVAGEWVLLAPACASFDQFSDYGERGDRFIDYAREEAAQCP
ncbi:MAG: UDP-N-acetylmuramoyl-L-alanine--D-glutamate ligase [Acidobacteriota bacterium]